MMISGPNSPNLGLIWPLEANSYLKIAIFLRKTFFYDPPYRPKHAPKRNPMANPDPTESSHTPRGSIAPMGHQGGALGHGYGDLHCCEGPFGLHRHVVPRAAFSDHMREQGRFHPNPSIRSRLIHP